MRTLKILLKIFFTVIKTLRLPASSFTRFLRFPTLKCCGETLDELWVFVIKHQMHLTKRIS